MGDLSAWGGFGEVYLVISRIFIQFSMAFGKTQQICKKDTMGYFGQKQWRKFFKIAKRRAERRRSKANPECQPKYGKYSGWEL